MLHLQASCKVEADGAALPSGHGWQSVFPSSLKKFCGHFTQDVPDPFLGKRAKSRSTTGYKTRKIEERMKVARTSGRRGSCATKVRAVVEVKTECNV